MNNHIKFSFQLERADFILDFGYDKDNVKRQQRVKRGASGNSQTNRRRVVANAKVPRDMAAFLSQVRNNPTLLLIIPIKDD